jgi:hypothetical protein
VERVGDRLDVLDPLAAVQRRPLDLVEPHEVLDRRVVGRRRLEGRVLAARHPEVRHEPAGLVGDDALDFDGRLPDLAERLVEGELLGRDRELGNEAHGAVL